MAEHFDVIIVGGGPAGLTAAIYARRAGTSVLLLEKESFGGQIASSPRVENFPGIASVSGAELADRLYAQAEDLGARLELEEVLEVRDGPRKTVVTDYGSYDCSALILATGMKRRTLGLPGEDTMAGISFCAVCDGSFYQGRGCGRVRRRQYRPAGRPVSLGSVPPCDACPPAQRFPWGSHFGAGSSLPGQCVLRHGYGGD